MPGRSLVIGKTPELIVVSILQLKLAQFSAPSDCCAEFGTSGKSEATP